MSFSFDWESISQEYAGQICGVVRNVLADKSHNPALLVGNVRLLEFNLGDNAPEVEILTVDEVNLELGNFTTSFGFKYRGAGFVTVQAVVQLNSMCRPPEQDHRGGSRHGEDAEHASDTLLWHGSDLSFFAHNSVVEQINDATARAVAAAAQSASKAAAAAAVAAAASTVPNPDSPPPVPTFGDVRASMRGHELGPGATNEKSTSAGPVGGLESHLKHRELCTAPPTRRSAARCRQQMGIVLADEPAVLPITATISDLHVAGSVIVKVKGARPDLPGAPNVWIHLPSNPVRSVRLESSVGQVFASVGRWMQAAVDALLRPSTVFKVQHSDSAEPVCICEHDGVLKVGLWKHCVAGSDGGGRDGAAGARAVWSSFNEAVGAAGTGVGSGVSEEASSPQLQQVRRSSAFNSPALPPRPDNNHSQLSVATAAASSSGWWARAGSLVFGILTLRPLRCFFGLSSRAHVVEPPSVMDDAIVTIRKEALHTVKWIGGVGPSVPSAGARASPTSSLGGGESLASLHQDCADVYVKSVEEVAHGCVELSNGLRFENPPDPEGMGPIDALLVGRDLQIPIPN